MSTRTYAIVEFGYSSGVRNTCHQAYLTLKTDGHFEFATEYYYSDWGDTTKQISSYKGTYQEDDQKIICKSTSLHSLSSSSDHEMRTSDETKKNSYTTQEFIFEKNNDEVICPIEYQDFKGKSMKQDVEVYKARF